MRHRAHGTALCWEGHHVLYNAYHNQRLRLLGVMVGQVIYALGTNLFIVPMNLYSGGTIGVCQLIRTLLQSWLNLDFGNHDIAGIIYLISNIPVLYYAYRCLGRALVAKTIAGVVVYSLVSAIIPIPQTPVLSDYLTSCLLGGIICAVGSGVTLTCGGSGGGLETIGVCLSRRGSNMTVGKVSLIFNAVLYTCCFLMYEPEILIYSVLFLCCQVIVLDRLHQQNVNMQVMIFIRDEENRLTQYITNELNRGFTYWDGYGGYTHAGLKILCVCLSKYEIEDLVRTAQRIDPHAFLTTQEGIHVYGNYQKKLG